MFLAVAAVALFISRSDAPIGATPNVVVIVVAALLVLLNHRARVRRARKVSGGTAIVTGASVSRTGKHRALRRARSRQRFPNSTSRPTFEGLQIAC